MVINFHKYGIPKQLLSLNKFKSVNGLQINLFFMLWF